MRDWTRRYFSDVFLTAPADLPVAWPTPRDSDPNDPTHCAACASRMHPEHRAGADYHDRRCTHPYADLQASSLSNLIERRVHEHGTSHGWVLSDL